MTDASDSRIMQGDIRETALFREAEGLYRLMRCPGSGLISDAAEVDVSPNGRHVVFAGAIVEGVQGTPPTRICQVDMESGDLRVLTFGPNTDRLPKYSRDGRYVAFLSDRHKSGDFQLYVLDLSTGAARSTPPTVGWVEYLHWSPDGGHILLGVAGYGADVAGAQGAVTSGRVTDDVPSWVPKIDVGTEGYRRRGAWVYELATNRLHAASQIDVNVWEVVWCGNDAVAAVVSPGSSESAWYSARLQLIQVESGKTRELYVPESQLGLLSASPSGRRLAFVEAISSDRGVIAGDLRIVDIESGAFERPDTHRMDVTCTEWRSDHHLLLAGHRDFDSVVSLFDAKLRVITEIWKSREITGGGRYMTVAGLNEAGDCVLVGESFTKAPEIAVIRRGEYEAVKSFDIGYQAAIYALQGVEPVTWPAPDGLEIQGWLLRPKGSAPHPLVMHVHGGPVSHWRPAWLGRKAIPMLMLLKHGYAVFLPNPRGSSGRGQAFAGRVVGDMGGADTFDYLSGLDQLIEQGVADPIRLGVTGGSYGGFMTSWLITMDTRFAAAVSVAPVTNQVSEHLISNIPRFVSLFLNDKYTNVTGKYFQRSPIMFAERVRTPTLNICGALDRCTPPEEAVQFHNALLEHGVKSVLVTYPEEGHGVRKLPAALDYAARVVSWFQEHMPGHAIVDGRCGN